ncbi:hypothetical protein ZWY2020_040888 [Hordeum vulgare]|nr:hypothetical protein ZWY2020_040888 [Hordeum vulgare]
MAISGDLGACGSGGGEEALGVGNAPRSLGHSPNRVRSGGLGEELGRGESTTAIWAIGGLGSSTSSGNGMRGPRDASELWAPVNSVEESSRSRYIAKFSDGAVIQNDSVEDYEILAKHGGGYPGFISWFKQTANFESMDGELRQAGNGFDYKTFYRCEEGYEEEAAKVIEAECRRLLQNLRHEARPQAIRDYYTTRGLKKQKKECRGKYLKKEQYMKVITYS